MPLKPGTRLTLENVTSLRPGDMLYRDSSLYRVVEVLSSPHIHVRVKPADKPDSRGFAIHQGGFEYHVVAPSRLTEEERIEFTSRSLSKAWAYHNQIESLKEKILTLQHHLKEEQKAYKKEIESLYAEEYGDCPLVTERWIEIPLEGERIIGRFLPWEDEDGPGSPEFIPFDTI